MAKLPESPHLAESDHYRAYEKVLQAEHHVLSQNYQEAEGKLVSVRVAGYLFLEFAAQSHYVGGVPSAALVEWFISPPVSPRDDQHDIIIESGTRLRDNFMKTFRTSNVHYPPPTSHPSSPPFDTLEDMIKDSMEATGSRHSISRKRVLARDGYRCVVTGIYDRSSLDRCVELRDVVQAPSFPLQMAYIFNEPTMQNIDPAVDRDSEKVEMYKSRRAAGALAILRSFGFSKLADAFAKQGGVHEAWNLIMFDSHAHCLFDRLDMWLEYTEMPHRYKVCTARQVDKRSFHQLAGHDPQHYSADMFVEFNSKLDGVQPPDPLLLALHAICARVAHLSGAAEFFDQVEWDMEETRVLASDGSSGILLDHLLAPF